MLSNRLLRHRGPDAFDIHPQLATAGQGIEGQAVGVGDVEMQRLSPRVGGERRFAMGTVDKADASGRSNGARQTCTSSLCKVSVSGAGRQSKVGKFMEESILHPASAQSPFPRPEP